MATKQFNKVKTICVQTEGWKKLVTVTVPPGKTAWPKQPSLQERVGLRVDFAREVIVQEKVTRKDEVTQEEVVAVEGVVYNEHNVQPNQGKISSFLKDWRDKHGGTHAVMATMRVKKGGDKADVEKAWDDVADIVKGVSDNPTGGVTAGQKGGQQG
ncbi:MAG: hypothetical protein Q9184_006883, partial [Pyrenodesmia sp. 2 TL-2023]